MKESIREKELKEKKICRFCLTQNEALTSIFSKSPRLKSSPTSNAELPALPLQVMACVSIEIYANDGMPSFICSHCRLLMDHSYRFKQICKRADTLLKQYPLTGVWPEPLCLPTDFVKSDLNTPSPVAKRPVTIIENARIDSKRIKLEAPPKPFDLNDLPDGVTVTTHSRSQTRVLKNDEEKKSLIQIKTSSLPSPHVLKRAEPPKILNKGSVKKVCAPPPTILNRSPPKILNKRGADKRMTLTDPIIKTDEDGKTEVVAGIVQNDDEPVLELDAIKSAQPVETNVFPCGKCERTFPLQQLLDIHMDIHVRERKFGCELCDKKFFSKYDLGKHALTHSGVKPFACLVCQKAFSRITLLHRHQKIHTDIVKQVCVYCNRQFLTEEELEKHSEKHMKNRPFECTVCDKRFAFKQGLDRHELVHAKDQPHPCNYCQKSFSTAGKLARHLTAHAGERPYPCKLCSKSFLLSHHLTRHLRSHSSGHGQYKCGDCDKIFHSKDFLIYHSAVHATENLTCPLCKEKFEDLDGVTEHIKSHTEGEQYACDYCDLIFTTNEKLDSHCENEHANELCTTRNTDNDNREDDEDTSKENTETVDYIISEVNEEDGEILFANEDGNDEDVGEFQEVEILTEKPKAPVELKRKGKAVSAKLVAPENKNDTVATRKPRRLANTVKNYAELVKLEIDEEDGDQEEHDLLDDIEMEEEFNVDDYIKKNNVLADEDEDEDDDDDDDDEDYDSRPKAKKPRVQKRTATQTVLSTLATKGQQMKKEPGAPTAEGTPKVSPTLAKKSTQQSITEFLKHASPKDEANAQKNVVKEAIRGLPKDVTVVKKNVAENTKNTSQNQSYKIPKKAVGRPPATAAITSPLPTRKAAGAANLSTESKASPTIAKKIAGPVASSTPKPGPSQATKAPSAAVASTAKSTGSDEATSPTTSSNRTKNGMEMLKIGNKMVEVKKIPLTKAQIQEMTKEGLIEKNGNKLVLKKKPTTTVAAASVSSTKQTSK